MAPVVLVMLWLSTGAISSIAGFSDVQICRAAVSLLLAAWADEMRRPAPSLDYDGAVFRAPGIAVGVCAQTGAPPWPLAR